MRSQNGEESLWVNSRAGRPLRWNC